MSTDTLQTLAIMGLTIVLAVVVYCLRKTMKRAAKLKSTMIRHLSDTAPPEPVDYESDDYVRSRPPW
jgi:hypothetical protein